MEIKRLLNWSEKRVERVLRRHLTGTRYRHCPQVSLSKAVGKSEGEHLPPHEFNMLRGGSLDFLIVTDTDSPVLAVEFDGPYHKKDERQQLRDIAKNKLCYKAGLPLLRVRSKAIEEHDKVSLLDYMLELFVAWDRESEGLKQAYLKRVREYEGDPEDIIDPGPLTQFAWEHPFPPTELVKERLWERYRIDWDCDERIGGACFVCNVDSWNVTGEYCIDAGDIEVDRFESKATVYPAGTDVPVFTTSERVSIASWLPLELNVPKLSELPPLTLERTLEELQKIGDAWLRRAHGIWNPNIPGVSPHDVAKHFADYLAYRAVEDWASKSLFKMRLHITNN